MDRYNPFLRRKIAPTQEDLDYARDERDRAEEAAHRLEREVLEAKQAARAERITWGEDYDDLSQSYDELRESHEALVNAVTRSKTTRPAHLQAWADSLADLFGYEGANICVWLRGVAEALGKLDCYSDDDDDNADTDDADTDDDPGEHFMDDDGRPEPDWVDGEE